MEVLSKATIETWILPYLTPGKRGFEPKVPVVEIVMLILYRLKTGCQWRQLPLKQFFSGEALTWNGVYHHFNKWSKNGCWKQVWIQLLTANRMHLDLSSIQLDGSHTLAKNGGQAVGYQGRKSAKTTNLLFLADNSGLPLALASPQQGQHHDLFEIQVLFTELCDLLQSAGINLGGLFLNADAGFDAVSMRQACEEQQIEANIKVNPRSKRVESTAYAYFDEELYKRRLVIERSNAWLDSFKTLLIRFETLVRNWVSFHLLAFVVLFLRRIAKIQKV